MKDEWMVITPDAQDRLQIGEVVETREFYVDDRLLKKYALSLRDPNPLYWDDAYAEAWGRWSERVCPSAFAVALNPMEQHPGSCPASAFWATVRGVPDTGRLWGGFAAYNRFELDRPIRLGDTVRCDVSNRGCYEKHGKRGVLVCVETEYRMGTRDGASIGIGLYGNMREFPYPEGKRPIENT